MCIAGCGAGDEAAPTCSGAACDPTCQECDPEESCGDECSTRCGDRSCDAGENTSSCPADCLAPACGDGNCDAGETAASCPADCPSPVACGNNTCEPGETNATCPQDCAARCGDGQCDAATETRKSCPADCPPCDYSSPPGTKALVLHYGLFPAEADNDSLMLAAGRPNVEVAFQVLSYPGIGDSSTCTAPSGKFKAARGLGVRFAKNVGATDQLACLLLGKTISKHCSNGSRPLKKADGTLYCPSPYTLSQKCTDLPTYRRDMAVPCLSSSDRLQCAADLIESKIKSGWDYISVDELSTSLATFSTSTAYGYRLLVLLDKLKQKGLSRRMAFWFSPNTTDFHGLMPADNLKPFAPLFKKCQTECRALMFEAYQRDPTYYSNDLTISNINTLAGRLEKIAAGTNKVSMIGLGIAGGSCYLLHSSVMKQLNWMAWWSSLSSLARQWRGFSTYGIAHVKDCTWLNPADLARDLRLMTLWWDTHP